MATRSAPGQDRAAALDGTARDLLTAGNPAGALHAVLYHIQWAAKQHVKADPASAQLMYAAVAGSLEPLAAGLPGRTPPRPPGYAGGPPSAADLTAVYEEARAGTQRQQGRQNHAR